MLVFPSMLLQAASDAGISTPADADDFEPNDFPHFHVFCGAQLAVPMSPGAHWDNAKVIAAIPAEDIKRVTKDELDAKGWRF